MENLNNFAQLKGEIMSAPTFSHTLMEEKFYVFPLKVNRLSGSYDTINITLSEKLMKICKTNEGDFVEIGGQFRSYNNYSGVGNRLILTLFAHDILHINEEDLFNNPNSIILRGYICKPTVYRTTPFGREITDIILAVNRAYGKSDYIPCIAWGRNAKYASCLAVGDNIEIQGRIQSREYQKKMPNDEVVSKTAFEISVSKIDLVSDNEDTAIEDR
ncbi:MAG: single-stranded DNA-binding protein [Monoglobales bacterium]